MAVAGLGQLTFPQRSEETRAACAGHISSEVRAGDRRAAPAHPRPGCFLWSGPPNRPAPESQKTSAAQARRLQRGRVLGLRPAGRTNVVSDPLTVLFRPVGRASPSPTLFRRKHAFSVGSGGRGAAHRRKEGTKPPRPTSQEATNG